MSVTLPTSQPLSLLESRLSNHVFTTTATPPLFRLGKASFRAIQPLNWRLSGTFKTVELRGGSLRPTPAVATSRSYSRHPRGLTPHSAVSQAFKSQLVANMSTRRSARLIAASELASSSSSSSATAPAPSPVPVQRGRKRKTGTDAEPNGVAKEPSAEEPPVSNKRRGQRASTPPPPTPTPSSAKLMGGPSAPGVPTYATPPRKEPRAAVVHRLADANVTLATLLSPETSRVVTSTRASRKPRRPSPSASPVQQQPPQAPDPEVAATANLLEEGNEFLISVDPRMRPLVENHHCRIFSPEGLAEQVDPFEALCSGIISQQVSGAAAKSIKKRFVDLFFTRERSPEPGEEQSGGEDEDDGQAEKRRFPVPSLVVDMPLEQLRTAGLSQRKAEYVSGLAEKFVCGELSAVDLANAPYEEVIERLTAVRGLGLWSAEMFACFGLKRVDVFSLGDLGVQRGMAAFVGRDVAKLKSKGGKFKYMSEAEMKEISDRFKPYRSLFMWYMWRVEETDISTME